MAAPVTFVALMPFFDYPFELRKIKQHAPNAGLVLRLRVPNTGSGIIFKGTGFYATDYKSSGPKCWRQGSK